VADTMLGEVRAERFAASRIRVHGDMHLGQVLLSGRDWVFLDFEGEPSRSPTERRLKRTAVVDLAGLIRSLDYAVHHALGIVAERGLLRPEAHEVAEVCGRVWQWRVTSELIAGYRAAVAGSGIVPDNADEFARLLEPLLVDRLLAEIRHHVVVDPERAEVSIRSLDRLLGSGRL
jgi:maltose alpha-D-glucosyltransferase/alpha-amylase